MNDLFSQPSIHTSSQPTLTDHGNGLLQIKQLAPYELCLLHIQQITQHSPFRNMMTPMGHPMKVSTSNCGPYGWIANEHGYQYSPQDPLTNKPWVIIPKEFLQLHKYALEIAQLPHFLPDSCLINRYKIGDAMGLHQDKDEANTQFPIVSISLGLSAVFQVGGQKRNTPKQDILIECGDVVILSGQARQAYHGIKPIKPDPLNPKRQLRYNLTLRKSQ